MGFQCSTEHGWKETRIEQNDMNYGDDTQSKLNAMNNAITLD